MQQHELAAEPTIFGFRRGRECNTCGTDFITLEVDEAMLHELARLRRYVKILEPLIKAHVKLLRAFNAEGEGSASALCKLLKRERHWRKYGF